MAATFDAALFRRTCARFATGVTIATVLDPAGSPHGLTINSFTSVSLEPPLVLICIAHKVRLLQHFLDTRYFGINVLGEHQQELSGHFARSGVDRFAAVEWFEGRTGVPLLPDVLATLECELSQTLAAGDHMILIGEVLHLSCGEGDPLAFYNSAYHKLHRPEAARV